MRPRLGWSSCEESIAKYAPGTQFALDMITMIGNTGTSLDSPFPVRAFATLP